MTVLDPLHCHVHPEHFSELLKRGIFSRLLISLFCIRLLFFNSFHINLFLQLSIQNYFRAYLNFATFKKKKKNKCSLVLPCSHSTSDTESSALAPCFTGSSMVVSIIGVVLFHLASIPSPSVLHFHLTPELFFFQAPGICSLLGS